MDKPVYLALLLEFFALLKKPENSIYRNASGSIDYLGLMLHARFSLGIGEPGRTDPLRIAWVHEQLSTMLERKKMSNIEELKLFLIDAGFQCSIQQLPGEIVFVVKNEDNSLTIIID